jgi:GrpB-like predicted nucleotidyltransferase (UPF0157 family)
MARRVEVVPYNPEWKQQAHDEARRIAAALGANAAAVHHIGSTSVPGLPAKPTLDFLVEVHDILVVDQCNPAMLELGYQPKMENGIPGRRYFQRKCGEVHTHHMHTFQRGHPQIERMIAFRDYLIAHPAEAQAYSQLKEQLASIFTCDALSYTNGKTQFIQEIDRKARQWKLALQAST